ncbi:MAG: hypothetical protein P1V51_10710 [Deltaproteobacteria bacterium]|nr:hypothetical protein [Deltaproteobacteria bacterium]
MVKATGKGAPNLKAANITVARLGAEKAAKLDAMRNILETLEGVEVTGGESVGGIIESNSSVKAKVQGVLRNFEVTATRYFSDGGVEVDVEMKLDGELASAVIPASATPKGACAGGTTGLVVDAKGTGVVPALAPRVLDASGKEVAASALLEPGAAADRGVAAYAKSVDEAKSNARVGCSPLVVKATEAKGSDVVLAMDVAGKVRGAAKSEPFLSEGRVMIVTD